MYMERSALLDQTFDMSSLADRMFTNKLYLSKTINILSGLNFRQFVNFYRVRRAMETVEDGSEAEDGGGLGDVRISLFGLVQHVLQGEHREDPFRMAAGLFT